MEDDCFLLAGGVAYQIFFAIIPLLALVVGVLGFIYGTDRAQAELAELFRQVYPSASQQEVRIARELVEGRALSLSIGVVGTILAASAVHGTIDWALAEIIPGGRRRSFVRGNLEAFGFVGGIGVVAILSFALSYGAQAAQDALTAAGLGQGTRLLIAVGSPILGLAAGYLFFYVIYRYVPRSAVAAGSAGIAALVSAVLWEIAKVAFAFFTRALGTFSAYGPLALAFGLLTWVYLTAVIILIGAEVLKLRARS